MIYIQSQQIQFPKSIYIGDNAELRCSFSSKTAAGFDSVSLSNFDSAIDFTQYDIKEVQLQQTGADYYTLVISFVPWRTGSINFPDFNLYEKQVDAAQEAVLVGTLHFEPVQIVSLVEQQNVTGLKNVSSPLLIPGTTYKIYAGIAVFLILCVVSVRLLIKRQKVALWFKNLKLRMMYAKNKKNTIKKLNALVSDSSSVGQICTNLQKIMREYLQIRLDYPFTRTLTSEMYSAYNRITLGLADENKQTAFENIISVFIRTDYLRFGNNAAFEQGELSMLVNTLIDDIVVMEEVNNA